MDPNIESQNQFNNPFTWQTIEKSLEIQTSKSQEYFLTTPPQIEHFESALSSMASSPVASNSAIATDNFTMRELIGKLGNICNTNDIPNYINSGNCSTNNSCYTTPLSSPPKMGISMPIIDHLVGNPIGLPAMPGDPGFAERAARFSSFGSTSFNGRTSTTNHFVNRSCSNLGGGGNGKLHRVSSSPSLNLENGSNRKRKATISKGIAKEFESHSQLPTISNKMGEIGDDSNAKRSKSEESNGKSEENKKPAEPQKDYIHVRARRGQATDRHSLAERVRREKISERMKLLQDLVPGCNRVTGKALMLDEIINYVQSLQLQVEFLSMKLSNVNPTSVLNTGRLFTKDEIQPNCPMTHPMYPTMVPTQYGPPHQNPLQDSIATHGSTFMDPLNPTLDLINHALPSPSPSIDGFSNCLPKLQSLCEEDLQSIVQMGFSQNENVYLTQNFHGKEIKNTMHMI